MKYLVSLNKHDDGGGVVVKVELGITKTEEAALSKPELNEAMELGSFIGTAVKSWLTTRDMSPEQRKAYVTELAYKPATTH
ncbi:MAG: hypothetical protein ACXW1W_02840 [Methylococcaceae bacterium]